MKATEQYFPVVLFMILSLPTKSYGVTIQIKPLRQYLCMVPFVF